MNQQEALWIIERRMRELREKIKHCMDFGTRRFLLDLMEINKRFYETCGGDMREYNEKYSRHHLSDSQFKH